MKNRKPTVAPPFKVVHFRNLPPKCGWEEIEEKLGSYTIEQHHIFNNQALIQFESSDDAKGFIAASKGFVMIKGTKVQIQMSNFPVLNSSSVALFSGRVSPSPVICIQLIHLRVYVSITDIYDECSLYGTIKKIICFTKDGGKFALVQMSKPEEAATALANLYNNPKHLPCFQMHVQYSKNSELSVKVNNSRSFDFCVPGAKDEFAKLRDPLTKEAPFFSPDPNPNVSEIFNIWSPVHFDPTFPEILCVTNLDETKSACMPIRNLFVQYGHVLCVKIIAKNRRTAFIQMATGFFARIATLFLQDCPFMGRKLQISFSSHSDVTPPTEPGCSDLYADYGPGPNDYPTEVYEAMYFPSKFVAVRGLISVQDICHATSLGKEVTVYEEENVIEFPSIEDSVKFISAYNGMNFMGAELFLAFTRPLQAMK